MRDAIKPRLLLDTTINQVFEPHWDSCCLIPATRVFPLNQKDYQAGIGFSCRGLCLHLDGFLRPLFNQNN